jgi:putative ABC transport system ATP-binding protein
VTSPETGTQTRHRAPQPGGEPAAQAIDLRKVYGSGQTQVAALDGVSATFPVGEFTAIMGPSGSGKSTFMHCLAGLDVPTSGDVVVGGQQLAGMSDKRLTALRRDKIGFVFQQFNLLPTLTAEENITLPLQIAGRKPDKAWFDQVVAAVNLRDRLRHRPTELSGGQQQRVACARALITRPAVVFADEPTGALDSLAGELVMELLVSLARTRATTVIVVTHDPRVAAYAARELELRDGRIHGSGVLL